MAHLPSLGACTGAAVSRTSLLGRVYRVDCREHVLLAKEFVGVLFGLGVEARVMIGVPRMSRGSAGGGRAHDSLVDAAQSARTRVETPDIVTVLRIGIAVSDEAGSTNFLRR